MNQDLVKEKLLLLDDEVDLNGKNDFKVIFSGKKSKKVNGLYKPESQEIIIHNKNFKDDNSLIYTAIHEFAHHINYIKSGKLRVTKAHSSLFWGVFHKLLIKAESLGVYINIFETNLEFLKLTNEIKEKYLTTNGQLMKDFGKTLKTVMELCLKYNVRFEDYIDRGLLLSRTTAKSILDIYELDVDPKLGFDNMKIIASIRDEDRRNESEKAMLNGHTPSMIKTQTRESIDTKENLKEFLEKEKNRIERTIKNLKTKLDEIETKLEHF